VEQWTDRLARLRRAAGLTQREVATAVGIKPSSVAQWETGRSRPDLERLPILAKLYRVTLEELCGSDFPAISQQGRLELLEAYDTMDEQSLLTLLNVAKALARRPSAIADEGGPASSSSQHVPDMSSRSTIDGKPAKAIDGAVA
jgi:transcriptional regulator with XRE-family HTH domain